MKEIVIASENKGKINEVQEILKEFKIVSIKELGVEIDIKEDEETFEKNAIKKAETIAKVLNGKMCIADDSGIEIEYLDGFPGVLTKRWHKGTDRERNLLLLEKLKGVSKEKRKISFVTAIALSDGKEKICEVGKIDGVVAEEIRGENGFGFDEIFELENGKTLAELSQEEKNKISARKIALEKLKCKLVEKANKKICDLEDVSVLLHSSIKINKEKVIYIDPFKIDKNYNDAEIIFITHDHYDHYSEEDIHKIRKENTIIVAPEGLHTKLIKNDFKEDYIITVEPNREYMVDGIKFATIPAYNINKKFHPKENGWVGYIIEIQGISYYIAGDTDVTPENKNVKCDIAFVPVGGTYTMDSKEAAMLVNEIKPKIAVPIHYGIIVGTEQDAVNFSNLLNPEIECELKHNYSNN